MRPPPTPLHELARLRALSEYGPGTHFDDAPYATVLDLARDLFGVPTAFVSLLDHGRQVFPARKGMDLRETSRDESFCAHTVASGDTLVTLDATLDPRFSGTPLVAGDPHIRFYAGSPLTSPSGHVIGTLCVVDTRPHDDFDEEKRHNLRQLAALVLDGLEMRRLQRAHGAGRTQFERAAAASPDGVVCAGEDGHIVFWNAGAERLLGYKAAEVLGRPLCLIMPDQVGGYPGNGPGVVAAGALASLAGRTVALDIRRRDGTRLRLEVSPLAWNSETGASLGAVLRDMSRHVAAEARLLRLAYQDPLTGLPNRTVLRHHVERLRHASPAALLLLGVDGFKDINDEFGRAVGDAVLRRVGQRLRLETEATATVARLEGDRFAVLLPGVTGHDAALDAGERLADALLLPMKEEGRDVSISVSVGVALHPGDGTDLDQLLANAGLALRQAKARGRRRIQKFTPALRRAADRAQGYDGRLREALKRGEFEVFYQPQIRVADGALTGAEALLRWRHPREGLLAPGAFMAALDRSPVSAEVGRWVLRTACVQAAAWRAGGLPGFRVGVNLFSSQFRIGDLVADVGAALGDSGLVAQGLELEITENTILRTSRTMLEPLSTLRNIGVGIAFDDYGTGYGSLSMLRRFPVTRLKIDRAFVNGMCTNPADTAIVRSVLFLARSLDIAVIAEGVETGAQLELLRSEGCAEVQGYLFGRPMPAPKFAEMIPAAPGGADQGG